MKKNILLLSLVFVILAVIPGCKSITSSTKDKQVNLETEVYGFKITAFDPATGSTSPTGMFGFGKIHYRSIPIEPGQPFYACHETYSVWGDKPASKSTIWIGRAAERSILKFEAVPNTMVKISLDGIKNNTAKLTVATNQKEAAPDGDTID